MRAIIQERYGRPECLQLQDVAAPAPGEGEVKIRVRAAGVNWADWLILTGRPYPMRLAFGLTRPKQRIPGLDVAGVVEEVGARVTRLRPGDEVFGEIRGAFAEFACVPASSLALRPPRVSAEQAAVTPVAGITALQGLRDKARLQPGERVLINGASGGVGTFAVQVAKALGAEVTGVCSGKNAAQVQALGVDHVIDYTQRSFTEGPARYDVILDTVGSAPLSACVRLLAPGGRYLSSVGRGGWLLKALVGSLWWRGKVSLLITSSTPDDLATLAEMIAVGKIKPLISRRYTLDQVPAALQAQGEGHTCGKAVITL